MINSNHVRGGTHTIKEANVLTTKMELIIKKLDDFTTEKAAMTTTTHAMDSCMTCEVCGNTGHFRNYYPETLEDVMQMNNNNNSYHSQQGGQTWNQQHHYFQGGNQGNFFNPNQPSLRDLVNEQVKINDSVNNKIVVNDKTLESLNIKIDGLSSSLKNQLSLNKMFET
jgi:hypothetical protein